MLQRSDLHEYQRRAVDFICEKKRCAIWLFMGAGKSAISLTAIQDMIDAHIIRKCLVISPLRVANSVWRQEALKWEHAKDLRISLCTGTLKERKNGLNAKADVYVINKENATWLVNYCAEKKVWPYDAVIIDESGCVRNPSAKIYKSLKKTVPVTTCFIELTGTPAPNGLMGLFSQMYLLDGGKALGKTFTGFRQRFFTSDFMGFNYELKPGAKEEIYRLINDRVLSMSGEDYLQLPNRIDLIETVVMPPDIKEKYDKFEHSLFMKCDIDITVDAINAAVLANKLLQFSNGAIYYDDLKNWTEIHSLKLDALAEIIEENESENILVAYSYKHDLERLIKRFPSAVVLGKDPKIIELWNEGKIKLLFAHPGSCGHGLNIQYGGSMIVWYGATWNLEYYLQMNARLHRQGQTKPVRVIRIVTAGTIDERVVSALGEKDVVQSDLLRALK
jgi:SNF2 family DNA or RNA helicase